MKVFLCVAAIMAGVLAAPGGHTGWGGVYKNLEVHPETLNAAKIAAKVQDDIFNDESLLGTEEFRSERKAVYIPTFFTNVPQSAPHPAFQEAQLQAQRFSRDTQVDNDHDQDDYFNLQHFRTSPWPTMRLTTDPVPRLCTEQEDDNLNSSRAFITLNVQLKYLFIYLFIYLLESALLEVKKRFCSSNPASFVQRS